MVITINVETKDIGQVVNLKNILKFFALPQEQIAIEVNKQVVRKKDWENIKINEADKIEIIHFVGGG